jgi:hypothetical protein
MDWLKEISHSGRGWRDMGVGLGYISLISLGKCVFENCKMRRFP